MVVVYVKVEAREMNLDFSKCKTKEDVENVFKENKEQLKMISELRKKE